MYEWNAVGRLGIFDVRIRLKKDIPVDEKHGLMEGLELDTIPNPKGYDGYWVLGKDLRIRIYPWEFKRI